MAEVSPDQPVVSILMANYNGAAYLDASLKSALRQTLRALEVVVVDDGSSDDSVAAVRRWAERDPRVRLFANRRAKGPAGARNTALDEARGRWVAVLDSDDLIHPSRLERLIAAAEADRAAIAADDLLVFDSAKASAQRFLPPSRQGAPSDISLADYLDENHPLAARPNLGFLKPVIRADALGGDRYDESLRIGEDFDLIARLLARGLPMRLYPEPTYLYRKHASSISHRLSLEPIQAMQAADAALVARHGPLPAEAARAYAGRQSALAAAAAFTRAVDHAKTGRLGAAAGAILGTPATIPLLKEPLKARFVRLFGSGSPAAPAKRPPSCCLLSRQRVIGATNGSSAYLLSIARAIRELGFQVHLLQPSPAVLGRWPVLLMKPEMEVFETIRIRGTVRLGPVFLALSPGIYWRAAKAVGSHLLARYARIKRRAPVPPPPAHSAPWSAADLLYLTRHGPPLADLIVCDYAFQAEVANYLLREDAPRITVMHDLFFRRAAQFAAQGAADSIEAITEERELALLSLADVIVAIQKEEAEFVRARSPSEVIVASMPADPVAEPQPGSDGTILFVASGAAPNVVGLTWFLEQVWPRVRERLPEASLTVAGNIYRAFDRSYPGVAFAGVVPDLAGPYRTHGVVISPLTAGSGLKIKLIEALAHGKAIVATSPTLQGVEAEVGDAVFAADEAEAFADACVRLLQDEALRRRYAEAALAVARRSFSEAACMAALKDVAKRALPKP